MHTDIIEKLGLVIFVPSSQLTCFSPASHFQRKWPKLDRMVVIEVLEWSVEVLEGCWRCQDTNWKGNVFWILTLRFHSFLHNLFSPRGWCSQTHRRETTKKPHIRGASYVEARKEAKTKKPHFVKRVFFVVCPYGLLCHPCGRQGRRNKTKKPAV